MNSEIQQKFQNYLDLHKSLSKMRKEQKETKTLIDKLEKEIKEYMTENDMDSIALKDGEIILYSKKVSQTFKKEVIMEKINEHLKDLQESETLTESILHNKKFILQDKIKAVIKKNNKQLIIITTNTSTIIYNNFISYITFHNFINIIFSRFINIIFSRFILIYINFINYFHIII